MTVVVIVVIAVIVVAVIGLIVVVVVGLIVIVIVVIGLIVIVVARIHGLLERGLELENDQSLKEQIQLVVIETLFAAYLHSNYSKKKKEKKYKRNRN